MDELNVAFYDYIEAFKNLTNDEKRIEIIDSLKETSALLVALAEKENISVKFLKSKEISELNNGLESEEDFLEALIVYIENTKNLLGQYLINKV